MSDGRRDGGIRREAGQGGVRKEGPRQEESQASVGVPHRGAFWSRSDVQAAAARGVGRNISRGGGGRFKWDFSKVLFLH